MNGVKELDQELAELKGFIAELKADRAAQKAKEKAESWTKYTSMSLVFIAVLAAIATQWAGKYSSRVLVGLNDATYYQSLASDEWSYYQANSIKQNLYEGLREAAPKDANGSASPAPAGSTTFNSKIDKYDAQKKASFDKAKALEQQRDNARKAATEASQHGGGMGIAISIFQISIALGSICLVTKKRWLWHLAMIVAALATVRMILVWVGPALPHWVPLLGA